MFRKMSGWAIANIAKICKNCGDALENCNTCELDSNNEF